MIKRTMSLFLVCNIESRITCSSLSKCTKHLWFWELTEAPSATHLLNSQFPSEQNASHYLPKQEKNSADVSPMPTSEAVLLY